MSQFCPKVNNIKAFRWLDSAIIHSNVFSFVYFFRGVEGGAEGKGEY